MLSNMSHKYMSIEVCDVSYYEFKCHRLKINVTVPHNIFANMAIFKTYFFTRNKDKPLHKETF